jgi:hypothetical protein
MSIKISGVPTSPVSHGQQIILTAKGDPGTASQQLLLKIAGLPVLDGVEGEQFLVEVGPVTIPGRSPEAARITSAVWSDGTDAGLTIHDGQNTPEVTFSVRVP